MRKIIFILALSLSASPLLADDSIQSTKANREKMHQQLVAKNQAASDVFFAGNKNADGVIVQPNGLQYKIITVGSGPIPASTNIVAVNLQCTLLDGTVIENTLKEGHPIQIPLNAPFVIQGLSYVLTYMPVGSFWEIWMPASLAYGDLGRGQVPPGAALKFNIQLISIPTNSPLSGRPTMDHY